MGYMQDMLRMGHTRLIPRTGNIYGAAVYPCKDETLRIANMDINYTSHRHCMTFPFRKKVIFR